MFITNKNGTMLQHAATVTLLIGMLAPVAARADPTSDFAKETLAAHNCYRAAHGVPPLEWSEEIAAYAQQWIDANGYEHSPSYESPIGPMGENLYAADGGIRKESIAQIVNDANFARVRRLFEDAIGVAQSQNAPGWELRTRVSRAAAYRRYGLADPELPQLAELAESFVEGRDSEDFRAAMTLLRSS